MALLPADSLAYFVLAVLLGTIVGLENEYRMQKGAKIFFGIRTSIFVALLGYLFAVLYYATANAYMIFGGIAMIIAVLTSLYMKKTELTKSPGITTFVSGLLVFMSGLLAGLGYYSYAIATAVLVAIIGAYKPEFIKLIIKIKRKELLAILNLLLIILVILPLLPNKYIGPYGLFNPFQFWAIVATVSFVFFLQYLVLKLFRSSSGLFLSTVIGSMITGTAITFRLVEISNKIKGHARSIVYNTIFSANIPMILVQALIFVYAVTLSTRIVVDLLPVMIVSMVAMSVVFYLGRKSINTSMREPGNPLPILQTFEFAVIFFIIFIVSRLVDSLAPAFLPLAMFVSSLANVAGASFALGFLFIHGGVSASYTAFLVGLVISAGIIEKGFIGLLSKDAYVRKTIFLYSILIGLAVLGASLVSFYGI
ncbi:MgtC/SapB family protein [Candidatus Parvarchaeota archaeon]|nr:MgtC/SapB family protein [Candidatus Parvarchaeota archaeon]